MIDIDESVKSPVIMDGTVRVRGIYATALTQLFLHHGIVIVSPSPAAAARFNSFRNLIQTGRPSVEIFDRDDRQGIIVTGGVDDRNAIVELIRNSFIDVIHRTFTDDEIDRTELEFPYLAKKGLDELRHAVVHTVNHHHRLRIIDSHDVDRTETGPLADHPEKQDEISRGLSERLIWDTYQTGKHLRIEHVKMNGQVIFLSEGEIIECNPVERTLLLKRSQFKGRSRYDGLKTPKQKGDYAMTALREGAFSYHHTYFRHDGEVIGTYYNINTPIECYPDKIRYVDLDIDVVRWPDGTVEIIDEDMLDRSAQRGFLGTALQKKAKDLARELYILSS